MTVGLIDNSASDDLNRSITWQYDNASKIIAVVQMLKDFFSQSTELFWNDLVERLNLTDIENCDDFGLSIWGILLSLERPVLSHSGSESLMTTDLYRRILLNRLRLLQKDATLPNIVEYINGIFRLGNIAVSDGHDMSLTVAVNADNDLTAEELAAINQKSDLILFLPSGVGNGNSHSDSLMFWLSTRDETGGMSTPPSGVNGGGLDESSFNWTLTQGA